MCRPLHLIQFIFLLIKAFCDLSRGLWMGVLSSLKTLFPSEYIFFSSQYKGDHSQQLCIDLQWPFPLRGHVDINHTSQKPPHTHTHLLWSITEPLDPLTVGVKLSGLHQSLHAFAHLWRIWWRMTYLTISLFFTHPCRPAPLVLAPLNSPMCTH